MTPRTPTRRSALALLAAPLALGPWHFAAAQQPATLRLVVPFPAGGTADILPRILSDKLRAHYPGGVVIENLSGAGGNIGAEAVYRAKPDGATLLASPPGPIAINQSLYPKLAFDPTRWVPITVMATVPNVLAVGPKVAAKSLRELVAWLKAHPGKASFASQGNGTTSHLSASLFMSLTGTEMLHVPYKGTAPALVDLMGGTVDVFFDNLSSSMVHHRAGKLQVLAVADGQRSAALPEVPTFAEAGLAEMTAVTWFAVMAPPGTPPAAVAAVHKALAEALALPDVRHKFAEQGAEPRGWSPEQTGAFVRAEAEKWAKVIKAARVTVD